jgi:flagellar motility protein MotE (MotC chaperone)
MVVVLALVVLVAKLGVSGFYYLKRWQPQAPSFPKAADASASPVAGGAAFAQAGGAGAAAAGSMVTGAAAMFGEAADPALAPAVRAAPIPLPPGDSSLLQPQRPSAQPAAAPPAAAPPAPQAQQAPQALPSPQAQPLAQAPPPTPAPAAVSPGGATSEELARREFEVKRREQQLNTREDAIRQLEADVNQRMRDAEDREASVQEILARNDAILEEQKSMRDEQQKRDDALKSERVEHLVAAFKGMKPEQAGNLINSMDDAVAVAILSAMPGSNAGKILAMVNPDKAARLVKAISEQRVDPRVLLESTQVPGV